MKISGFASASLRVHSVLICLKAVKAAVALALFGKQIQDGIAIALKTAKTPTTTTNSIRENPLSFFYIGKNNSLIQQIIF